MKALPPKDLYSFTCENTTEVAATITVTYSKVKDKGVEPLVTQEVAKGKTVHFPQLTYKEGTAFFTYIVKEVLLKAEGKKDVSYTAPFKGINSPTKNLACCLCMKDNICMKFGKTCGGDCKCTCQK